MFGIYFPLTLPGPSIPLYVTVVHFYCCVIVHDVTVPSWIHLFSCGWVFGLFPGYCHCEQYCYEHSSRFILLEEIVSPRLFSLSFKHALVPLMLNSPVPTLTPTFSRNCWRVSVFSFPAKTLLRVYTHCLLLQCVLTLQLNLFWLLHPNYFCWGYQWFSRCQIQWTFPCSLIGAVVSYTWPSWSFPSC